MSHEVNLQHLGNDDLASLCAQETNLYFKHQNYDTRYCFELFRRAIEERSKAAWESICVQYQKLVTGWVIQHYAFAATREEAEYFVNGAFGKISGTLTADKFGKFSDLGYLLRYLKMCVHSVIMDYNRTVDYTALYDWDEATEEESEDLSPEEQAIDHSDQQSLWELIRSRLHDDKERAVIEGSFVFDLKPQEIYEHFRGVFIDVDEVYRVKQNVISRLRRDSDLRKLLDLDD
jgi:hypothetical protein